MMEILPPQAAEFNSETSFSSPYATAPSSPHQVGTAVAGNFFFYSVPASPARVAATASDCSDAGEEGDDGDFAFDFNAQIETKSLTADELFDGGKIKPLKPPPRFLYDQSKPIESPKSPARTIREALSPCHRNKDFDPFAAALEQTRRESVRNSVENRGRERSKKTTGSSSKGSSRSLSPYRVSDLLFENNTPSSLMPKSSFSSSLSSLFHKKWRIKDLLLFRSASESRAKDEEQMKKQAILRNARLDSVKTPSFRSACSTSSGSVSPTSSRRQIKSAHEVHYTLNRAVSEEMKKKTSLPYKPTLFSCLGFHPSVHQFSGLNTPHGSMNSRTSCSYE